MGRSSTLGAGLALYLGGLHLHLHPASQDGIEIIFILAIDDTVTCLTVLYHHSIHRKSVQAIAESLKG